MKTDERFLLRALALARKGAGKVSPNPLAGCVIVKNGKIIGEGYHRGFGKNHAEIEAFRNLKQDCDGADLYVNLEPCSHYGKTPPCADEIIQRKIKRVFAGMQDPNPLVSGRGIAKLLKAGIEVVCPVLPEKSAELNRFFVKYISTGIPYVTLKIAQTLDGKIADNSYSSKWITGDDSRKEVHRLRSQYDAVLTGINTIVKDNPGLNVRAVKGRNPAIAILDAGLRLNPRAKVFSGGGRVIVIGANESKKTKNAKILTDAGAELIFVPRGSRGTLSLSKSITSLAKMNIASLLVEGGGKVFSSFLRENLADEINLFIAPRILGSGIPAVSGIGIEKLTGAQNWTLRQSRRFGSDIMLDLRKSQV